MRHEREREQRAAEQRERQRGVQRPEVAAVEGGEGVGNGVAIDGGGAAGAVGESAPSPSRCGRFGAGPSENLLCRLGLPRALAAGDLASREKPLFLPRGGPRGGGEKPVPLRIWYSLWRACLRRSYRVPPQAIGVMYSYAMNVNPSLCAPQNWLFVEAGRASVQ